VTRLAKFSDDRIELFRAHHSTLVKRLARESGGSQFVFAFANTGPGRAQLGFLARGGSIAVSAMRLVLGDPAMNRRGTDPKLSGQLDNASASSDMLQHHLAVLR